GLNIPAITLNTTWGAPRFDTAHETEVYSLNGQDLVLYDGQSYTNPHRDGPIGRQSERSFYLRKEGAFLKIKRHGNSPDNYWWEVVDKNGITSYYGKNPDMTSNNTYVLTDAQGNIAR